MIVRGASVIGKVLKKLVRVIDSYHYYFSDFKIFLSSAWAGHGTEL